MSLKPKVSQPSRFAHLNKAAKVASSKHYKGIFGALVGLALLFFLVIVTLSFEYQPHTTKNSSQANQIANHDMILQQNEQRLRVLRKQHQRTLRTLRYRDHSNKALIARRNAPTEMYHATDEGNLKQARDDLFHPPPQTLLQLAHTQRHNSSTITGTKIQHPDFTIAAGEMIHGVLETSINSDLPGMVGAVITQNVYAYVGERPLLPKGSRLIGQYKTVSNNGDATARLFIIWNRVITPEGVSIMIQSPSTDVLGQTGMPADRIDTHFWKKFGRAALLSVMSAGSANVSVRSYDQPNSANQYRQSMANAFGQAAQSSLSHHLNINPTLHIHQGDRINVFVAHNLNLYSVLGHWV